MERNIIILIVSLLLVGLFLSEINEVTGQNFRSVLKSIKAKTITQQVTCSDTDGADLSVKGTVSGTVQNSPFTKTDVCISKKVVNEYYCDANQIAQSKNYACPEGYNCQNGACV